MKFLNRYFDDSISLTEYQQDCTRYENYLQSIKDHFDEETYRLIKSGFSHDCQVKKVTIEDRAKSDFRHCLTVTILLSSIENQYELTYQGVSYLSFDKAFDSELGFDDLLIDECILEEDVFVHELTFVGNIAWMIKSKEIHIRGTH